MFDLLRCSKLDGGRSILEFILVAPVPVDTAAKLSAAFSRLAQDNKQHTAELNRAAKSLRSHLFCSIQIHMLLVLCLAS